MGTWSNKPFGNDTASDWALKLVDSKDDQPVKDALTLQDSEIDAGDAERAIAAAALVASAAADPLRAISSELKSWIRRHGYVPTKTVVNSAIEAIDAVMQDSELRDLWEESEALESWLRTTTTVRDRLSAALEDGLPSRSAKKPGMPRNLGKLIERYREDPDAKVLAKIREKLEKLEDPDKATRQTGFVRPIYALAEAGLVEEMKLLIERGVEPFNGEHRAGHSPMLGACKGNQLAALQFLVDAGVPVVEEEIRDLKSGSEKWMYDQNPDSWLEAFQDEPEWCTHRYSQPLWFAVRWGSIEIIEYLLAAGADIYQQDLNGETLLHKAAHGGRCDVMEYLIEKGFNVNADSHDLEAPIFHAIRGGQVDAVRWLAEHGADVNALSWMGGAPLDWTENKPEIAAVLRERGARERSDERRAGAKAPSVQGRKEN